MGTQEAEAPYNQSTHKAFPERDGAVPAVIREAEPGLIISSHAAD